MLPSFVNYVEGIYVGYKYYETADDEGAIDYDAVVQYPFGYGLSYTTFDQRMSEVTYRNGTIGFDVTVTNTGETAGKDVVEVFYNPPYINGGIEKSSVNLIDFAKTDELEPGESTSPSPSRTRIWPPTMPTTHAPTCSKPVTTRSPSMRGRTE